MDDFSRKQEALVDLIVEDAERQLANLYLTSESRDAVIMSGVDDRPVQGMVSKQFDTVRTALGKEVESALREITAKIGICDPKNPVYETWDDFREIAKKPLTSFLISAVGTVVPQVALPATVAAIVVIVSFSGLEKFCDRYVPNV